MKTKALHYAEIVIVGGAVRKNRYNDGVAASLLEVASAVHKNMLVFSEENLEAYVKARMDSAR